MVNTLNRSGGSAEKKLFFDVHTHKPSFRKDTFEIFSYDPSGKPVSAPEDVRFSAGIHPWNIDRGVNLSDFPDLISSPGLMAVGETGIDRVCGTDTDIQTQQFKEHIEISERIKKPLVIHCVRGASDIASVYKDIKPRQNWLIHGFNGKKGAFEILSRMGLYFSFGEAALSQGSNASLHIRKLDLNKILIETDDASTSIEEIYGAVSEILCMDISRLHGIIRDNFCRFFGVKDVSELAGENRITGKT